MLNFLIKTKNIEVSIIFGYRKNYSTEMLLLKVVGDIFKSFDRKIPTVVILLDLSAAFDKVYHVKPLEILQEDIGIRGAGLKWFKFLITDRTQNVKIEDTFSDIIELLFGVLQRSVLGPILFKIYVRSFYRYMSLKHNLK